MFIVMVGRSSGEEYPRAHEHGPNQTKLNLIVIVKSQNKSMIVEFSKAKDIRED